MTQRELAEKMQVSFQTISKWENGINLPDVTHLPKLAEIFGPGKLPVVGGQNGHPRPVVQHIYMLGKNI